MMFHFMDELRNWSKTELERRKIKTIDASIKISKELIDFKNDMHDKEKAKDTKTSHGKGGVDQR